MASGAIGAKAVVHGSPRQPARPGRPPRYPARMAAYPRGARPRCDDATKLNNSEVLNTQSVLPKIYQVHNL